MVFIIKAEQDKLLKNLEAGLKREATIDEAYIVYNWANKIRYENCLLTTIVEGGLALIIDDNGIPVVPD